MLPKLATQIEVGGQQYRLNGIDARSQTHVVRYLAPFQAAMFETGMGRGGLVDMAKAFAGMPREHVDWIMDVCLASISRKDGDGWQAVVNSRGVIQYADISGAQLFILTQKVVAEFASDFFVELMSVLGQKPPSDTPQPGQTSS